MLIQFLKDFYGGLKSYYKAFELIFNHWLWVFFVLPLLLSFGIMIAGDFLLEELKQIDFAGELAHVHPEEELTDISFRGFPTDSYEMKILIMGIKLILMVVTLKMNKYIVLIFMAPVMTILSTRTEYILTGNRYPFNFKQFIDDLFRGVNFALRNMFVQIFIFVMWYGLTLIIPFIDQLSPIVFFVVGSYFYGASLMDYTNERRRLSMEESVKFARQNAGITIAVGLVFTSLFFVTHLGIIFAPIFGVVAATIAVHEKYNLRRNKYAFRPNQGKNVYKSKTKEKAPEPIKRPEELDW